MSKLYSFEMHTSVVSGGHYVLFLKSISVKKTSYKVSRLHFLEVRIWKRKILICLKITGLVMIKHVFPLKTILTFKAKEATE